MYPEPTSEGRWVRPVDSLHVQPQWWPKSNETTPWIPVHTTLEFPVIDD